MPPPVRRAPLWWTFGVAKITKPLSEGRARSIAEDSAGLTIHFGWQFEEKEAEICRIRANCQLIWLHAQDVGDQTH